MWPAIGAIGSALVGGIFSRGNSTHTTEIRYVDNQKEIQALQQLVEETKRQLEASKIEARVAKNPLLYREARETVFASFLEGLMELELTDTIPRDAPNQRHVCVMGPISCGKSSLLTQLTGVPLQVGLGHTTKECQKIFVSQDGSLVIWDAPGINEDFDFYDPACLAFIHSLDVLVLCFENSICSIDKILKTASVIKQNKPESLVLVRTKIDNYDPRTHRKTVAEEKEQDIADAARYSHNGASHVVLAVSARDASNQKINEDWNTLKKFFA